MIAITSLFLFTSTGYAIINAVQNIEGSAKIVVETQYICESKITAEYKLNTSWNESDGRINYNALIIVTNGGTEDILDWEIIVKGPSDIIAEASADITIDENGIVTMRALSWNNIITPGNSLTLEFRAHTVEENFEPEYIYVNGCLVYGNDVGNSGGGTDSPTVELTDLSITPETYTMSVGETAPLQAIKTPSNATANLVWSSNNENIVRVNNSGVITAVSPGNAIITVSSGNITAQSSITVEESSQPPETPLNSLAVNPQQHQMKVGETYQLTATKNPADATANLTWSSSDSNIVEVTQDGLITAKASGNATITVSSGDIRAESYITVEEQTIELYNLTINPQQYQMKVGENYQLTVTKNPTNATANLTWSSSNSNIVEVTQDGLITAKASGNATITVSSGNVRAESYITVSANNQLISLTISPAQHQMEIGENYQLTVTKNPTDAPANLVWSSSNPNIVEVTQDGLITAKASGNATITVSSDGISSQSNITVRSNASQDEVTAVITQNGENYWGTLEQGYSTNLIVTITNNSGNSINGLEFTMNFPEGTTFAFYDSNITNNGNTVNYNNSVSNGSPIIIYGQITLPPNYEVSPYFPQDCTINEIR